MRHTDAEIADAARRFEEWADRLDPGTVQAEDISDLAAIAEAADEAVRRDEALIAQRVADARAHGRSSEPHRRRPRGDAAGGAAAVRRQGSLTRCRRGNRDGSRSRRSQARVTPPSRAYIPGRSDTLHRCRSQRHVSR